MEAKQKACKLSNYEKWEKLTQLFEAYNSLRHRCIEMTKKGALPKKLLAKKEEALKAYQAYRDSADLLPLSRWEFHGANAFKAGIKLSENPFPKDGILFKRWEATYKAAEKMATKH